MLRGVTNLVRKLYGQEPIIMDLETWANNAAQMASPDDLIAASIIQSFAKDFDKWTLTGGFEPQQRYDADKPTQMVRRFDPALPRLKHSERDLCVNFRITRDTYVALSYTMSHHGPSEPVMVECSVNGTAIDLVNGHRIRQSWDEISAKVRAAKDAAAKAKAAMEANERKWNLAEKLLGMKRNEFGALVPVESAS